MSGSSAPLASPANVNQSQQNFSNYLASQGAAPSQSILNQFSGGNLDLNSTLGQLQALSNQAIPGSSTPATVTGPNGQPMSADTYQQLQNAMATAAPALGLKSVGNQQQIQQLNKAVSSIAPALGSNPLGNSIQDITNAPGYQAGTQQNINPQAAIDQLMTGSSTGSQSATQSVMNNPILGQIFGQGGQLQQNLGLQNQQEQVLNNLQNQGFNLQPQDMTLYGQEAGNIARQFGQQGNQAASDLASRGLSSSGAAGAQFSGLAGNQNEMLAQAQQQIAQQRFQNTINQIGQQQNFINQLMGQNSNLAGQGANDIQQQYGRQLTGAEYGTGLQNQALQNALAVQGQQQNISNEQFAQQQATNPGNVALGAIGGLAGSVAGGIGQGIGNKVGGLFSK